MHEPACVPSTTVANAHPTTTTEERCASSAFIYTHGGGIRMYSNHMLTVTRCRTRYCVLAYAGICSRSYSMSNIVADATATTCTTALLNSIASCNSLLHEIWGLRKMVSALLKRCP